MEQDIGMIENLATINSQTDEIVDTSLPNESTNSVIAGKSTRNMKNKTESKASKTTNVESGKMRTVSEPDTKILKRKAEHPPTSEMVMDSIKALKKPRGVTFDDIKKHMEEKYAINMKALKSHVNKFLQKSIHSGVLERVKGANAEGKFKIKKPENIKKSSQNSSHKEKSKPAKKMVEPKKKVKK